MAVIKMLNSKATPSKIFDYLTQDEKTEKKLVSGKDCNPNFVKDEFAFTQGRFNKTNGIRYHHLVQSFSPNDNITLDKAHKLGEELAKQFEGYEVFIATHKDKEHIHNHLVVNSVSFETGKKYRSTNKRLWDLKRESNRLCEREGFATLDLDKKAKERLTSGELRLELRGVETWKGYLKEKIDLVKEKANDIKEFCKCLKDNYNIETRVTNKTISYKHPDKKKAIRGKKLGEDYTKGELEIGFTRRKEKEDFREEREGFKDQIKRDAEFEWKRVGEDFERIGVSPSVVSKDDRTSQGRDWRDDEEINRNSSGSSQRNWESDRTTENEPNRDKSRTNREDSRDTEFEWESRENNRGNDGDYNLDFDEDDEWEME